MNNRKLESIIIAYKILRRDNPDTCIIDCKKSETLEQAIELAASARNLAGRKHRHQCRIPNSSLDLFKNAILKNVNNVKLAKSFEDLITIIRSCRFKGISDLTIYDTAHRIGSYLNIQPQKVYLHRGTKKGAEVLLGKIKGNQITVNQLPEPFQNPNLNPVEIEDILCIYKDRLRTCI